MVNCTKCGANNIENAQFCQNCGEEIILNSNNIKCPHCKADIPSDAKKCKYCNECIDEKYKPVSGLTIALGYIFSILGGIIGFIIALYLITRKNPDAKKHGTIMLVIFGIWVIIILIMGITIISYY